MANLHDNCVLFSNYYLMVIISNMPVCLFVCLAIGSISMTDQSDDEFDHDNLVESKVGTFQDS